MSRRIREEDWQPAGVDDLEHNAWKVVRSTRNKLVVAGPGAGKTELLAQRADFLFSTGRCTPPKRILAISFKRDAAANLKKRVEARSPGWADRFESLTLDAFAKRLVDRFRMGLPEPWRPRPGYQVRLEPPKKNEARAWMLQASRDGLQREKIGAASDAQIRTRFARVMHGAPLPYTSPDVRPIVKEWGLRWWREVLSADPSDPSLTFPMLNRLAAYLLRCNPKIVQALRATYAYVFLDEFQDTTEPQWDLVTTAFEGSTAIITAVGDDKQRIMQWAGAMPDAFDKFQQSFGAERVHLIRNYRSAPELVEIQNRIAKSMEEGGQAVEAAGTHATSGICEIWDFHDHDAESEYLAEWIASQVRDGGALPQDFCILVRQKVREMIPGLRQALRKRKLRLRDESNIQDLRVEPVTKMVVAAVRLAGRDRDPDAWDSLLQELTFLTGLDDETDIGELERLAVKHREVVRDWVFVDGKPLNDLPAKLIEVLGRDIYRHAYPQYGSDPFFQTVVCQLGKALQESMEYGGTLSAAIDDFSGVGVIPAMTIHKSKGLEFDTVIFIGLDDQEWWGFESQPKGEKRAFFVAFSRAIRRVVFTFSHQRASGRHHRRTRQETRGLYDILLDAGVEQIGPLRLREADAPNGV